MISQREYGLQWQRNNRKDIMRYKSKNNQRGLTKKEERLGWITRGHEPQATSIKPQASSDKLTQRQTKKDI